MPECGETIDRSPRRSTRVPRTPRQLLLLDRPCYVCSVPRLEPLSSRSPCMSVHGADLRDYGGAQLGCISPRQEGQHVDGEGRPRSARFRTSATNQRPPKPPRVSPETKRRRDNLTSQMRKVQYFAGTMSARREKIVCTGSTCVSVWRCLPVNWQPACAGPQFKPGCRITTKIWTM